MKRIELSKVLSISMLVVLIIIGSQLSDSFLSVKNFSNIMQYSVETAFISIGMTLVLLIGGIDLSVALCWLLHQLSVQRWHCQESIQF